MNQKKRHGKMAHFNIIQLADGKRKFFSKLLAPKKKRF